MKSKKRLLLMNVDSQWSLWWSFVVLEPNDWFTLWDCIYNHNADLGLRSLSQQSDDCSLLLWLLDSGGVDLPLNGWVNENCFLFMTPCSGVSGEGFWITAEQKRSTAVYTSNKVWWSWFDFLIYWRFIGDRRSGDVLDSENHLRFN